MLAPKRVKHRKVHRGRMKGKAKGHTEIQYGDYAIVALEPGWITNRQIEASRVAMTRHIKRGGKVWINDLPRQARHRRSPPRPAWARGRATRRAGSRS